MTPRRLNQLKLEPDSRCLHCDRVFEKPYQRMPELEKGRIDVCVLKCPECGLYTVFEMEP